MRGKQSRDDHAVQASAVRGAAADPGKQTLTGQLSGGGVIARKSDGGGAAASPGASFEHATSGAASELPHRGTLERAFGTSFGDVQAYVGGDTAQAGLSGLGAQAAAHGNKVAFREAPSLELAAHETAHIVQQRGGGGVQCKPTQVSAPSDEAEGRADAAAAAVVAGLPVPDVGTAPGDGIHRKVETSGGTWTTPKYEAVPAATGVTGDKVGCHIVLNFTPNELVEAPASGIGITQTVKSQKSSTAGGKPDTFAPPSDPGKAMVTMGAGSSDPGRAMDRMIYPPDPAGPGGNRAVPNTNPMYGVYNPGAGGANVSKSLNDNTPSVGKTQFGAHTKKADGSFNKPVDAVLEDRPGRFLEFDHQTFEQTFESAAVVMAGPLANQYLGSVRWGYSSASDGTSTLLPTPIEVVQQGNPSVQFMDAAKTWNDAVLPDRATPGTNYDTVNLPLDNAKRPTEMTTVEIITALGKIDGEITAAPPADQPAKRLHKRALENELKTRWLEVTVLVKKAQEGTDEVYVKAEQGGHNYKSPQMKMSNGQKNTFWIPLGPLLPITGKIAVKVYDWDMLSADDMISNILFDKPYAPASDNRPWDGAEYNTTVKFDR